MNKLIVSLSPHVHGGDSVTEEYVRCAYRIDSGIPRVALLFRTGCGDCYGLTSVAACCSLNGPSANSS